MDFNINKKILHWIGGQYKFMMRNRILFTFIVTICLLAFIVVGCGNKAASDGQTTDKQEGKSEYTLRIGIDTPPQSENTLALKDFAKRVSEKTNGKVKIDVFPSGQLGSLSNILEMAQNGSLEMTPVYASVSNDIEPSLMVAMLPFMMQNVEENYALVHSPVFEKITSKIENKGIVVLDWWVYGLRELVTKDKMVQKPEDMKGLKIRAPGRSIVVTLEALGATPTPMPVNEAFSAMQVGTINSVERPWDFIISERWQEIAKYTILTHHSGDALGIAINKGIWDKMPDDIKKALKEAALEAGKYRMQLAIESKDKLVSEFNKKGKVIELDENQRAEFKKAAQPAWDKLVQEIGKDVADEAISFIEQYRKDHK